MKGRLWSLHGMSDVKRSDSKDWEDKNVKKKSTSKSTLTYCK